VGKALLLSGSAAGTGQADTTTIALSGGAFAVAATAEANSQCPLNKAGTLSNLAININTTGTTRSITMRNNGANGNQTVAIADGAGGIHEDAVNTDTIAAADKLNTVLNEAGTNPTVYWIRYLFDATSNHVAYYGRQGAIGFSTASTTAYGLLSGGTGGNFTTTIGNAQQTIRAPGVLSRFNVFISANNRTTTTTISTNIGGSAGNGTVSVTSGATGLFEDATNTDTVSSGSLVCIEIVTGTGTETITVQRAGVTLENTTDDKNDLFAGAVVSRSASATVHYLPLCGGSTLAVTTESQPAVTHSFSGTVSRLRMYLSANTLSGGNGTVRLRKGGTDGNQVLTLTAATTGLFEDTTNTDTFVGSDTVNLSIVDAASSGSITATHWAVTEEETAAAVSGGGKLIGGILTRPKLIHGRLAA
jgi:hypothetical protein